MKYKVIALALMMVGLACQAQNQIDKQGRKQGHWVKTDKQGAKIYEGDFVNDAETGTFTYYYPNGTVRIKNVYTEPGKICKHEVYDPNGQLLAKGNFNQKNRDGLWEFFSNDGKIIKKTTYKMGVRHGLQVLFTSKGDTAEVCNWADNHRHGRWWKRIGENGYITATYVNGRIEGRLVEYNNQQQLVREGHYTKGERNGSWSYYEDGQLVIRERWSMGSMRDREVRLLLPEERFVSIYDMNYLAPQGKKKTIVYLSNGTKLVDNEPAELVFGHVGSDRFTLANKESRIMVATDLIVGTTRDNQGREILSLDPNPDFSIFPDEDCMKLLRSLKLHQQTESNGGEFDFDY
ncbi:MAG: hypothetical protein MJZ67_03335 [Bacteroidales bacterium]|nr:hypothetical protein [Bacteroidales bacterium]